ncbi:hypothetical protein IscW_ISCW006923 [Ixodes scapularis]|uniref:Uncharacterized protein n=1 Tax=Ixodes scapularis TaxID=6945 RepID=B7PSG6_IXOSC|nr:hypothetical protein IscW_ISCW006923 [Ixodes scapularis]|eukprot:XP_002402489.1 hypothetical protein IscW_ISCW006923 [Ixodes scapularis]
MFNMFTGHEIEEPMQMISLFYVGYLKNKDESPQGNSPAALYDKVMEICLNYCVDLSLVERKKMWGDNVQSMIMDDILESLGGYTFEELGTLKVSATYNQSMYKYDEKQTYDRQNVVELQWLQAEV